MSQDVPGHVVIGTCMFCIVNGHLRISWDVPGCPRTCSDWDWHVLHCRGTSWDVPGHVVIATGMFCIVKGYLGMSQDM